MTRIPTLLIDSGAIAQNTRTLAASVSGAQLMAVVKADGFGHGVAALSALDAGATWLGGTSIAEMLPYRELGLRQPILSWLNPVDADFDSAVEHDIDVAVPSVRHLHAVAAAARRRGVRAAVHLHIDLGMSRDGAPREAWRELCELARQHEASGALRVRGIMGHLSRADQPEHPQTRVETLLFENAVRVARHRGLAAPIRHLAATAASLTAPSTHFDMVRVGAGLYGIDPSHTTRLAGAMTLRAPILSVRDVPAGTGVGYGHSYVTSARTRLALLPLGYADGLPRHASERAWVQVGGGRARVAGTISMDQTVVDLGDLPGEPGDDVVLFGPGDAGEPTVADWATWSGSIEHDIVTHIGSRVVREHRGGIAHPASEPAEVL